MIHTYLFDLYGTLVDIRTEESMPSLWRRMALFLSLQGAAYTAVELKTAYSKAIEAEIDRRRALTPSLTREHIEPDILRAFNALFANKGVTANDTLLQDVALLFRTLSMGHLRLYPDAKKVLQTLRKQGKGVYLLSNAQRAFTMPELNKLEIASLFDGIILSSDVGVKKPDGAIFAYILAKYDLNPKTCLMVGNDIAADMMGAEAVGIAGRYIHTKQSPPIRRPLPRGCKEIDRLVDLLE